MMMMRKPSATGSSNGSIATMKNIKKKMDPPEDPRNGINTQHHQQHQQLQKQIHTTNNNNIIGSDNIVLRKRSHSGNSNHATGRRGGCRTMPLLLGMIMGIMATMSIMIVFFGSSATKLLLNDNIISSNWMDGTTTAAMSSTIINNSPSYLSSILQQSLQSSTSSASASSSSSGRYLKSSKQKKRQLQEEEEEETKKQVPTTMMKNQKVLSALIERTSNDNNNNNHHHQDDTTPLLFPPNEREVSSGKNDDGSNGNNNVGPNMIAYMSMGPASEYSKIAQRLRIIAAGDDGGGADNKEGLNSYRFFYHSYDEDCDGCIYKPKTTYPEGKNLLIKHLLTTSTEIEQFKYIVFFDDDIQVLESKNNEQYSKVSATVEAQQKNNNNNNNQGPMKRMEEFHNHGWETFHKYLLDPSTTYPLLKPKHRWYDRMDNVDMYQSCTDECIWVIRPDYLYFFFPYVTSEDGTYEKNIWLNSLAIWAVMEKCFPAGMKTVANWSVFNPQHRYDITSKEYQNQAVKSQMVHKLLNERLPSLAPWPVQDAAMIHRCNVKSTPSVGIHPECSRLTKQLFDEWLASPE